MTMWKDKLNAKNVKTEPTPNCDRKKEKTNDYKYGKCQKTI